MEKTAISKKLMLVAGILAAIVILFSQAFEKEACQYLSKIKAGSENKTEKAADADKKIVVVPSSDAVTSSVAAEIEDTNPSLIREIVLNEDNISKLPVIGKKILSDFFKTLFRVVISPQAP